MSRDRIHVTPDAVRRLLLDAEPWLSCDDCFDQLDGYVEALLSGTGGAAAPLRAHLVGCRACMEEARGLVTLVAADRHMSNEQALFYLDSDLDRRTG